MAYTPPTSAYVPKYGDLVYFAPEGATIETVTVAKDEKPAGLVFTDWETLGCIEDGDVAINNQDGQEVWCFNASTGEDELIQTGKSDAVTNLQINLTLQYVTPFILQLAYAAESVSDTDGSFVPGSLAGGAMKGWLKVQQQRGTEVVTVLDLWVEISLSEAAKIRNRTEGWKPKIQAVQLKAADEAGAFGSVSA